MDNDVSHAVQAQLDALDARVTALEGGGTVETTEETTTETTETVEETETPTTSSRRGRSSYS